MQSLYNILMYKNNLLFQKRAFSEYSEVDNYKLTWLFAIPIYNDISKLLFAIDMHRAFCIKIVILLTPQLTTCHIHFSI